MCKAQFLFLDFYFKNLKTYQILNKRIGCINRDWNAVYNMKKLTLNYLEKNERCECYIIDFLRENL